MWQLILALVTCYLSCLTALVAAWGMWYMTRTLSTRRRSKYDTALGDNGAVRMSDITVPQDIMIQNMLFNDWKTSFMALLIVIPLNITRGAVVVGNYAVSNWKLVLIGVLMTMAGQAIGSNTRATLEGVKTTYDGMLGPFAVVLKTFLNLARILYDIVIPWWNVFIWTIRIVPLNVLKTFSGCLWEPMERAFLGTAQSAVLLVEALTSWLSGGLGREPLDLAPSIIALSSWATGTQDALNCMCWDLGFLWNLTLAPFNYSSGAYYVSNATNIVLSMVRVASNATGEPGAGLGAHRPDFDPFYDAITGTIYSAGNFANRLLNTLATLVYTAADPSMDATTTVFCDDDTDKYCYDGIKYYVPRPNWVVGTRPKVPLKKWWKLSSVNKIKSFYTGAKVFEFPVYPIVAVVESARLMTRCVINLDKLQSVGDISDDPAGEKQAIWSADRVFDALDGINESISEIFLWLLDWDGLPGFIRWAPLLWRDISMPFGHIWLGMAHWAYFAGVDTMVGAINAAQGTISFFEIMVAMYDKFQEFIVQRALTVCEDMTLMVEGEDYPLGCLVKNSCDAVVQLVNGSYGLLNWALVGANECQVPGPYGTYERKTSCFKADSAERVMDPAFAALSKCGPCMRHLLSLWYYLKPGSSGGQPIEDCLARENVSWVVELVPEPSTGGVPYRPNSAFNPSAILDPPPPGPIRETSFWLPKCRNATSCYGVTCRTEFYAWTDIFEWARSASGQRCTPNPACDPRFGGCDAASCAPGCMECANGNTYWPAPPPAIGGTGNTLSACAGGTGSCSIMGQRCVDAGLVYICGARDAGDCTADASINVLCWSQQGVSTEAECMDTNGTCGVPGDTGCEPYAGVEQECGTRSTDECTTDVTAGQFCWSPRQCACSDVLMEDGTCAVTSPYLRAWLAGTGGFCATLASAGLPPDAYALDAFTFTGVTYTYNASLAADIETHQATCTDATTQAACTDPRVPYVPSMCMGQSAPGSVVRENVADLCGAYTMCANRRCVNTAINVANPSCNVGSTLESLWTSIVALLIATWELLIGTLQQSIYANAMTLDWPYSATASITCNVKQSIGEAWAIVFSSMLDMLQAVGAKLFDSGSPDFQRDLEHVTGFIISVLYQIMLGIPLFIDALFQITRVMITSYTSWGSFEQFLNAMATMPVSNANIALDAIFVWLRGVIISIMKMLEFMVTGGVGCQMQERPPLIIDNCMATATDACGGIPFGSVCARTDSANGLHEPHLWCKEHDESTTENPRGEWSPFAETRVESADVSGESTAAAGKYLTSGCTLGAYCTSEGMFCTHPQHGDSFICGNRAVVNTTVHPEAHANTPGLPESDYACTPNRTQNKLCWNPIYTVDEYAGRGTNNTDYATFGTADGLPFPLPMGVDSDATGDAQGLRCSVFGQRIRYGLARVDNPKDLTGHWNDNYYDRCPACSCGGYPPFSQTGNVWDIAISNLGPETTNCDGVDAGEGPFQASQDNSPYADQFFRRYASAFWISRAGGSGDRGPLTLDPIIYPPWDAGRLNGLNNENFVREQEWAYRYRTMGGNDGPNHMSKSDTFRKYQLRQFSDGAHKGRNDMFPDGNPMIKCDTPSCDMPVNFATDITPSDYAEWIGDLTGGNAGNHNCRAGLHYTGTGCSSCETPPQGGGFMPICKSGGKNCWADQSDASAQPAQLVVPPGSGGDWAGRLDKWSQKGIYTHEQWSTLNNNEGGLDGNRQVVGLGEFICGAYQWPKNGVGRFDQEPDGQNSDEYLCSADASAGKYCWAPAAFKPYSTPQFRGDSSGGTSFYENKQIIGLNRPAPDCPDQMPHWRLMGQWKGRGDVCFIPGATMDATGASCLNVGTNYSAVASEAMPPPTTCGPYTYRCVSRLQSPSGCQYNPCTPNVAGCPASGYLGGPNNYCWEPEHTGGGVDQPILPYHTTGGQTHNQCPENTTCTGHDDHLCIVTDVDTSTITSGGVTSSYSESSVVDYRVCLDRVHVDAQGDTIGPCTSPPCWWSTKEETPASCMGGMTPKEGGCCCTLKTCANDPGFLLKCPHCTFYELSVLVAEIQELAEELLELAYYVGRLFMSFLGLVTGGSGSAARYGAQIVTDLKAIMRELVGFLEQCGRMVWEIFSSSPMGKLIEKFFNTVYCEIARLINFIMDKVGFICQGIKGVCTGWNGLRSWSFSILGMKVSPFGFLPKWNCPQCDGRSTPPCEPTDGGFSGIPGVISGTTSMCITNSEAELGHCEASSTCMQTTVGMGVYCGYVVDPTAPSPVNYTSCHSFGQDYSCNTQSLQCTCGETNEAALGTCSDASAGFCDVADDCYYTFAGNESAPDTFVQVQCSTCISSTIRGCGNTGNGSASACSCWYYEPTTCGAAGDTCSAYNSLIPEMNGNCIYTSADNTTSASLYGGDYWLGACVEEHCDGSAATCMDLDGDTTYGLDKTCTCVCPSEEYCSTNFRSLDASMHVPTTARRRARALLETSEPAQPSINVSEDWSAYFSARATMASPCTEDVECSAVAPFPAMCANNQSLMGVTLCDSCPARYYGSSRLRVCNHTLGACQCVSETYVPLISDLAKDPRIGELVNSIPWEGRSFCDVAVSGLLRTAEDINALSGVEAAVYEQCVQARLYGLMIATMLETSLPIDIFYNTERALWYAVDTVRIGYLLVRETLESSGMLFPKRLQDMGIDPMHFHMLIDFWERYVVGTWNVWDGKRFAVGVRAAAEAHFDPTSGRMMESDLFNTANAIARVSESLSSVYDEATHGLGRLAGVMPTLKEGVATGMDAVGSALEETRGIVFNSSGWAASAPNTSMPNAQQDGAPAPSASNTSLAHRSPSALAAFHRSRTTREFEERMARNMRRLHWIVDGGNSSVINEGCQIVDVVFQELWAGLVAVGDYYTHNFPGSIIAFRQYWAEPDEPAQFALPPTTGRAAGTDTSVCGANMSRDNVSDVWSGMQYGVQWLGAPACSVADWVNGTIHLAREHGNDGPDSSARVTDAFGCDIERIMSCSTRHAIREGGTQILALYLIVSLIIVVMFPFSTTLLGPLWAGSGLVMIWWLYAFSPACLPMLPTCLADEYFVQFDSISPLTLTYPDELIQDVVVHPDGSSSTLFVACEDSPYSFHFGTDNLAFAITRWAPAAAETMLSGTRWERALTSMFRLRSSMLKYENYTGHDDVTRGHFDGCFWLTALNWVPLLGLGSLLGVAATRVSMVVAISSVAALNFMSKTANLFSTIYVTYPTHAQSRVSGHVA